MGAPRTSSSPSRSWSPGCPPSCPCCPETSSTPAPRPVAGGAARLSAGSPQATSWSAASRASASCVSASSADEMNRGRDVMTNNMPADDVRARGEPILFRPAMYAGSVAAVLQGRECWGLPKKFAAPMLRLHDDTVVGTLQYSGVLVARATMGYGRETMDAEEAKQVAGAPGVVLKIIPNVDGTPRILELVRF